MGNGEGVLVTAIGSHSADVVVRNLKNEGYRVVATDIYPAEWVPVSRDADAFHQVPPASGEEAYIKAILAISKKEGIRWLVPLIDAEIDVLNRHRDKFEKAGICLCMSGEEEIEVLRDKFTIFLKARGILNGLEDWTLRGLVRTIPTWRISEADVEQMTYPLIMKPVRGRSSIGLYRIFNETQLRFALSSIVSERESEEEKLVVYENYIAQPFIKGNVVTVDIVRDRAGHMLVAAREELLRTGNGAGLSVRIVMDRPFLSVCRRLAQAFNITGTVNFEFIKGEKSGVYYFVECNPRFSGGVAFSEMAGVPVVAGNMKCFSGGELDEGVGAKKLTMARKYVECLMKEE